MVMLAIDEGGHQSTPASFFSLSTSSATEPTLTPALRPRRLDGLQHLEPRRDVDAESAARLLVERLLLGLHDVGQRGVARLVEAQVGGHDRRQLERHGLQAAVDLARHRRPAARRSRPWRRRCPAASRAAPPASGRSGCSRRRSPACRGSRGPGSSASTTRLQDLGDGQRLDRRRRSSQGCRGRRPWRARCGWSPAACCGPIETATISVALPFSFRRSASSTAISSKGFIDILTLARSTPEPSGLHADLHVVVDHPLDGHQDLHAGRSPVECRLSKDRQPFPSSAPGRRWSCPRAGEARSVARGLRRRAMMSEGRARPRARSAGRAARSADRRRRRRRC